MIGNIVENPAEPCEDVFECGGKLVFWGEPVGYRNKDRRQIDQRRCHKAVPFFIAEIPATTVAEQDYRYTTFMVRQGRFVGQIEIELLIVVVAKLDI